MLVEDVLDHKVFCLELFLTKAALIYLTLRYSVRLLLCILLLHLLEYDVLMGWLGNVRIIVCVSESLTGVREIVLFEVFRTLPMLVFLQRVSFNLGGVSQMCRAALGTQHSFILVLFSTVEAESMHSSHIDEKQIKILSPR